MDVKERAEIIGQLQQKIMKIAVDKGEAYSGENDCLSNFKRNGSRLGLSKYQIWAVYFNKHIDAINNAIAQNPQLPEDKTEGLPGRIIDAITYLHLLACLLSEEKL